MADKADNCFTVANVDDAAGFMAAARAYRQQKATEAAEAAIAAAATTQAASNDEEVISMTPAPDFGTDAQADDYESKQDGEESSGHLTEKPTTDHDGKDLKGTVEDFTEDDASKESAVVDTVVDSAVADVPVDAPEANGSAAPRTLKDHVAEEEGREYLTTFKTWGAPPAREKPVARVRRVILKALPTAWRVPAKVLSLIHGGAVESIKITPAGNAHVVFCEHDACKAFYDAYPNGISLKGATIYVEMGTEVDVVSSQMAFNLSVGATRVVRAIGVDMNITMGQLVLMSTTNNRKVEKIFDEYMPHDARKVTIRFCSIDDAVRFRGAILRDADWEHCNIQYAVDPCEIATGVHQD